MRPDFISVSSGCSRTNSSATASYSVSLLFGLATPVLSVDEGADALLASLKSLQQRRQGASGEKGDPFAVPTSPLGTLAALIYLGTPPAQGGERARERWSTTCSSLTTQRAK
jgi:hypothetical protein